LSRQEKSKPGKGVPIYRLTGLCYFIEEFHS
jgi:hypothetical protein